MNETTNPKLELNIVLKDSFALYFRGFFWILLVSICVSVLKREAIKIWAFFGALNPLDHWYLWVLVIVLISGFRMLLITVIADRVAHGASKPRDSFRRIIHAAGPVLCLALAIAAFLIGCGFAINWDVVDDVVDDAFVFAALLSLFVICVWLMATFVATVPVLVAERAGWSAMRRSFQLVHGHRDAVFVSLFVVFLIVLVCAFVGGGVIVVLGLSTALQFSFWGLGFRIFLDIASATIFALLPVSFYVIYLKLVEIKEGLSAQDISDVFA